MNKRTIDRTLTKKALTEEFEEAEVFGEDTKHLLNEVEKVYAEILSGKGMEVRFNDLHILAKGDSNTVFTHLRSNLPEDN